MLFYLFTFAQNFEFFCNLIEGFFNRLGKFAKENLLVIAIVASILVLLIIGIIAICCYKRKKRKENETSKAKYKNSENKLFKVRDFFNNFKDSTGRLDTA